MALNTSNNASLLPLSPQASSFLKYPSVSSGTYNLGTPAATQPTNTSLLTSGLSIGSGGQALVNGQKPAPYTPVSAGAGALIGTLPGQTNPNTQPAVNYGTPTTAAKPAVTSTSQPVAPQTNTLASNTAGGIGSKDIPQNNYTQNYAPTQNSGSSFPGLLNLLTQTASQGTPEVQSAQDKYQQAIQQQKGLKMNLADALATNAENPIPLVFQQGRAQILQQQAASQLDAAQQAVNQQQTGITQAQTAQGQQLGALGTAAGLASPVTQAGLLTNPQTGQPLNPGVVASAVQQASQLVQNGADVNSPQVQALLNPFGFYGAQAFTAAQQALNGGGYNPTQQSAGAQQNASQATQTQQTAFNLNTALKQLSTEQPLITNFLQKSGLNSQDNPEFNSALNTYYGQFLSPGNKQLFEGYMADIKKYTSQILAANSGTIPTDVANTLANFDPSHLTASQLGPYLDGLAQLGNNQVSVLQGQQQATGGSPQAYSGSPTSATSNAVVAPQIAPSSITSQDPVIQGLIGGTLNLFGGVGNTLTGLASHFF